MLLLLLLQHSFVRNVLIVVSAVSVGIVIWWLLCRRLKPAPESTKGAEAHNQRNMRHKRHRRQMHKWIFVLILHVRLLRCVEGMCANAIFGYVASG